MLIRTGNALRPRSGRRLATHGLSFALLLATGCINLDLPTVPPAPPAPYLTVVTPQPGDTIGLSAQVSVAAASVYGISSVKVLCGPQDGGARTIQIWTAPPYLALVDFSLCQGLTIPNLSADGGFPLLELEVVAQSDAGVPQEKDLQVLFDAVGPVLSVLYPPSAQPKAPFTVVVTSDRPLRSFPEVTLDSQPATSVTVTEGTSQPTYNVFFQSTPGLGTDNVAYSPGVPVPIEVLTDTERMVRLVINATALNGNSSQLNLGVDLTRVVWDRYIPGRPASTSPISWAAEPVAFDGGLLLPLATGNPVSASSDWIPGRFSSTDGTFYGFQTSQLPGGLDGGYVARGLNAQGQTLFFNFTGNGSNLLLAPPPGATVSPVTATGGPPVANAPLTQVDDLLCLQDSAGACSDAGTMESLSCFDPQLREVTTSSGVAFTGPPTPGIVAGGGGRYLSPNVGVCGSSWNLVDIPQGTISFGPTAEPPGCAIQSISKLLAVGDGTFVVQLVSSCAAGIPLVVYPILRVGAGSTILGSYTAPLASPSRTQAELVGVLADGRVVTLSNAPPYTTFALWSLDSAAPDVVSPIAGLYDTADSALGSVLAQSTYSGTDGSFAVLLSGATLGVGVLAFAPNLEPRWLYVYPRTTLVTDTRLVTASSFPQVYLVDEFNEHAVSLQAGAPVPGGGPSDAGADGGASLRTVSGFKQTIYQPPGFPTTVVTPNLTTANITASPLDAGVYGTPLVGVGYSNGTFAVNVPAGQGDNLLNLGTSTFYLLPDSSLAVTTLGAGRANVVPFNFGDPADATVTATLTNLAPWNSNDVLEALSLGANDFVNDLPGGCNPAPLPNAGGTTLTGAVFSMKNSSCGGPNTIEGAMGDTLVIAQLGVQQTSTGTFYLSLSRYFETAPLSLGDGQNVTVVGAMTTVNQNQTVNCDFRASQFAAAVQGLVPTGFTNVGTQFSVNLFGASIPTTEGVPLQAEADFLSYQPPSTTADAVSGPMTYGVPPLYPFSPYGFIIYFPSLAFAFPGTTAAGSAVRTIGMQMIQPMSALCAGPIVPTLTPVNGLTLNGADAFQPLTGVGLTPVLAWNAPAVGTPTRYIVIVTQFFKSTNGLTTLGTVVGQIYTRERQVRIPPGVLSSGNTYSVDIVADDSLPIGAGYLVLGQNTAGTLSNVFTP